MNDRPPDPGFTPISPNPYIVGNPVRDRSMFFGREAEFDLVRRRFQDSTDPSHCGLLLVFCGERRSGKTSILFQIMDKRLGPDFIPVLIDMQSMAVGNEIDFLTRVSEEIRSALGPDGAGIALPKFSSDSNHYATFRKFVQEVMRARPQKRLVLLFDEYELFENKIDEGLLSREALLILANLMENERVYLILTGSQHLDHRRREYWEKFLPKSDFRMISFLEREDAISLIRKPVEGRVEYADEVVDAIYRLTAGQPFYTQAICQSLVDNLNEIRSRHATREGVAKVVDGIVNNPLPQMKFLWDGFERDEKLVLALLAECLPEEGSYAGFDDLKRQHQRRRYRLGLDEARIAPTLEKLFKSDILLRRDRANRHQYAFRMDLWRLWIRRQHSVWQVRRELAIPIPKDPFRVAGPVAIAVVAVAAVPIAMRFIKPHASSLSPPRGEIAYLTLTPEPADAMVYLEGRAIGRGTFRDSVTAAQDLHFRVIASGYADTQFALPGIAAGQSASRRVELRALFGDLQVETQPPGARVKVDGVSYGTSPVTVHRLAAAQTHRVEATLAGYGAAQAQPTVAPDSVVAVTLPLAVGNTEVRVSTEPPECSIRLDGKPRGRSPYALAGVPFGTHTFAAALEGYLPAESTVVVSEATREVHLILLREPPGTLIVQGDHIADIYVDDTRVTQEAQNSGPRSYTGGPHQVHVTLKAGGTIDTSVVVRSREVATFDYSRMTITHRPERGARP